MNQLKLFIDNEINVNDIFKQTNVLKNIDFNNIKSLPCYKEIEPFKIDKHEKKLNGNFYTKDTRVLNELSENININTLEFKLVDPSCGEGDILIHFIDKFINIFINNIEDDVIIKSVFDNFYGFDVNPKACLITKYSIFKLLTKYFKNKLIKYDFNKLNIFCLDFTFKTNIKKYYNYFDIIVGNPPFITYYGKHAKPLSQEKKKYYIYTYDFIKNKNKDNRLNSSMFFIENGLNILKKNGFLNYILDISFFEPPYKQIRDYINYYSILKIVNNIKGFKEVYSGQIIISIKKSKTKENVVWKDFETQETIYITSDNFNFVKPFNKNDNLIINKIENNSKKMSDYFDHKEIRTCAVLTGRTDDFVYNKINPLSKNNYYPFLEGSKGLPERFELNIPNNRFLEYDYKKQLKISDEFKIELAKKGIKNKKRIGLGDEQAYQSPKIFVRQSAKKLICVYTDKLLSANNSIYVIFKKDINKDTPEFLKYICCILNSEVLTFYALKKNIIRLEKGKIPQIRLSDLYNLPIKICEKQKMNEIIECIYNNNQKKIEKMNKLISELYNITDAELNYIIKYNKTIESGRE